MVTAAARSHVAPGESDRGRFRVGLRGEQPVGRRRTQGPTAAIVDTLHDEINAALVGPKLEARFVDLAA